MWKKSVSFLLALTLVLGVSGTARADEVAGETAVTESAGTETAATEAAGTPVDEGHFPDAIFRGFVLDHCDLDGDGRLSSEETDAVVSLDVSGLGIGTLQGLELFDGLKELECQNNALTELNLSGNRAMEALRCYGNGLTSLDVSGCPELRTLHCGNNALTELNLAGNPALTTLQCQENALTSLDVSGCHALDFLVCADNALPYLDLSANEKLTRVQAEGNVAAAAPDEDGVLELADLPGFDPDRASGWTGASLNGTVLTPEPRAKNVTFTYDLGGKTADFVWQLPKTGGIPIDERHFPDANFRLVVSHQLDTTPDGLLTDAEIAGATRIEAESYEIASLEGLACFTELRELICGGNRLPFVDVSANGMLADLSAEDNQADLTGRWDRTLDLASIPGFDPARASGWEGERSRKIC